MRIIKAPMIWTQRIEEHSVFLAGGISKCPNWQEVVTSHIKFGFDQTNLLVLNPRRDDFDVSNTKASEKQIVWEHDALNRCDTLLFWFPKDTPCPITLYELGNYCEKKPNLIVGVDPDYQRKLDVTIQTRLRRPDVKVQEGFDNFLMDVSKHLRSI